MSLKPTDTLLGPPRLPGDRFLAWAKGQGAHPGYVAWTREIVAVCAAVGLDDAIVAFQGAWETDQFRSPYFDQGNTGGIGIDADGVPSPFATTDYRLAARIHVANLLTLMGRPLPPAVRDATGVPGVAAFLRRVAAAAADPKRPAMRTLADMCRPYRDSHGERQCTYACDDDYATGICQRANASGVDVPDQGAGPTPSPGGDCPTATTTTTTSTTTTAPPVPVPATPPLPPGIVWVGTPNFFPNRQGFGKPVAIVYHCTNDLTYQSTESWFQDPSSNASAHFVITRDGVPHQFVSSVDAAWTNGDVRNPRTDIPWLNKAVASGRNLNDYTIAYEFVATPDVPPTEAQYVTGIALSRYFCALYGISPHRGHQLRHSDINSVTRSYCPGDKFDLARIVTALGGDPANMEG